MLFDLNTVNGIIALFVFAIGACIGSFLNVVIYRVPLKISIVHPRSSCPSCQKPIPLVFLIPIVGFFLSLRKCKYCQSPISFQYLFVELLAGSGTLYLFFKFFDENTRLNLFSGQEYNLFIVVPFLVAIWIFYTGIVLSFIDFKYRILPDVITIPGIFVGILLSAFNPNMGLARSLVGAFLGVFGLFCISKAYEFLRKKNGMGMGDVKYLGFIGAVVGWEGALYTIFIASILGALFGILLGFYHKKFLTLTIPFGPFLALGALIASVWQNDVLLFISR